jgi:hypothetical protein
MGPNFVQMVVVVVVVGTFACWVGSDDAVDNRSIEHVRPDPGDGNGSRL